MKKVYQFKISLEEIEPTIWRRIQVPETCSFWDLHVAIQDVMPWLDYHLHQFELINPITKKKEYIGIPETVYGGSSDEFYETLPGWDLKIADYFSENQKKIIYLYDFGDHWNHYIEWEGCFEKENTAKKYPLCLDGKNAAPPEDCGGVPGYERIIESIESSEYQEHIELFQWLGGNFESYNFKKENIRFSNPARRLQKALDRGDGM